mgnify:CR=1 FL=1
MFKKYRKVVGAIAAVAMTVTGPGANACTSFLLKAENGDFVYGRTLEFALMLNSQIIVMPRGYENKGVGPDGKAVTALVTNTGTIIADGGTVVLTANAVDGIVTNRAVDVGNLVTVGTPSSTPLFTVADQSKLRLYARVPQNYAPYIRDGMTVTFTVPQYPGRTFDARLAASAGAVASATGTMLVQFSVDNKDGALQPGAYAEVKFPLPPGAHGIRVPATALLFRDEGMTGIIVEQHAHKILPITDHAVVLERGRVVLEAPSAELLRDASPLERLLGVAGS